MLNNKEDFYKMTISKFLMQFFNYPSYLAAKLGNVEFMQYLYENNYKINAVSFSYAVLSDNSNIIKWFEDHNIPWDDRVFNNIGIER